MKELQELRNYILELKNMGVIKKTTEITLLHKLNALEKQFDISSVVKSLPSKEDIYVSQSNDGSDDVYCAFTDHTRGLKDCEEAGTLLTRITLYRD